MQYAASAAARAGEWSKVAGAFLRRTAVRIKDELGQTVDIARLRQARTWEDRLAAVSLPRAAVIGIIVIALVAALAWAVTRPDPYRPAAPTAREIALRQTAVETAPHAPPPGLVEANKSLESAR